MELDFDKYCVVDRSPTTVLQAPQRRSKVANRKSNGKLRNGNERLSINKDFAEISFNRYRSASCRDVRSRRSNQEDNELLKRGSVYQSSKEVRLLKKTDAVVGRKKIELSRESASKSSFGIIDSLCGSDDDMSLVEQNRSSAMPLLEPSTVSVCKNRIELPSRTRMNCSLRPTRTRFSTPSICSLDHGENQSTYSHPVRDPMIVSESVVSPINDVNSPQERDLLVNLHKSLSAKLAFPHSPLPSDSGSSKASSPKARFSTVKKIFDPYVKSKSQKSSLSCAKETVKVIGINHSKTIHKTLLNDLSEKPHHLQYRPQFENKENHNSVSRCSPAHLHAVLKSDNKHGVPYFEFSVKSPEDVYVAKTWKVGNALTWVYTFHSLHHIRKSNASGWGYKDSNRESHVLGQLQVSCRMCTELKGDGALDDSMVTEFVLYDVAHSRKSTSSQDNSSGSPNVVKATLASDNGHFELSASQPLAATELHPELEIASIIMQVPFEKRESLKFKNENRKTPITNLLDHCRIEQAKEGIPETSCSGKMHVVIPAGNHSFPINESGGPSPLLDRWRFGGGCDCGGWDMACPLNIFHSPNIQIAEGRPMMDDHHPAELFVQGRKDTIPAFTMRVVEEGSYAVDFHAQLSSLQAFSICVAILHASQASTAIGQERSMKQVLKSDSLRIFAEEEIESLINSAAEKDKIKVKQKTEEALPSFVVNPPFSPIARV